MVTLTFTGTPAEIHSDMREMLNLTKGAAATLPAHVGVDPALPGADKTAFHKLGEGPQPTRTEVAARIEEAKAAPAPAATEEKPKRTRRTKAEIEAAKNGSASPAGDVFTEPVSNGAAAPAKQDVAEPAAANVSAPIVNKEAVHQALQQVNVAVGLPKAREILTEFKVNRISEIKEDQYKAFIEKCNAAVMMA